MYVPLYEHCMVMFKLLFPSNTETPNTAIAMIIMMQLMIM